MQPERARPAAGFGNAPPRLVAARRLLRAWPHLPAFWPEAAPPRPIPALPSPEDRLLLPEGHKAPPGWGGGVLHLAAGPFAPPPFGARAVPAILFAGATEDPLAEALATPAPPATAALRERLRAARLGGAPGLPDPGPAALGCGPGEAVLLVDPCDPARHAAALALRAQAEASAAALRLPLRILRDPAAPADAPPLLADSPRFAPWTLFEAAAALHALPGATARLAAIAGAPLHLPPEVPAPDGLAMLGALAAAARCADPVRMRPLGFAEALDLLGAWRREEAANRRIAICLGMSFWKRRQMAAALASAAGTPGFARSAGAAIARAAARGGAIAAWPSRSPPGLAARAAQAGVPVVWVEDGFIRSVGLGAGFLPAASLTLDRRRPYFDAAGPSELEILLATAEFPPALLARAAALRAALIARGITKYNLGGAAPDLPATPGRRRILVPGQVEDDLSIRLGAAGAVRGNLALLRAVRAAHPDAFIAFKPHPDVEAGYRRGAIPAAEAARLADVVLPRAPMAPLLARMEEVHTITSLTGFEALLRGLSVTCWGQPFYAGWGLTRDCHEIARRVRKLSVNQLIAGALILFPRYQDPVTALPCDPETLLDRLEQANLWSGGPMARLRRWQGRLMARFLPGRG